VGGLVMTASSDGVVRLFRNHDCNYDEEPSQLVTGFRALHSVLDCKRGAGLVTGWSQYEGTLLVGGDSRKIMPWNVHHERPEREISTGSDSMITSFALRPANAQTFVAAFGDGTMRLYDKRVDRSSPIVKTYNDHGAWIQNVRWLPYGESEIMSASVDGEVKLWDSRGTRDCLKTWSPHRNGLSAFDVHSQTGVFASSSAISTRDWRNQTTIFQSLTHNPPNLGHLSLQTGLHHPPSHSPSMFHAAQSSLAFHPYEMLLAIGGIDGSVKIIGCNLGDFRTPDLDGLHPPTGLRSDRSGSDRSN